MEMGLWRWPDFDRTPSSAPLRKGWRVHGHALDRRAGGQVTPRESLGFVSEMNQNFLKTCRGKRMEWGARYQAMFPDGLWRLVENEGRLRPGRAHVRGNRAAAPIWRSTQRLHPGGV